MPSHANHQFRQGANWHKDDPLVWLASAQEVCVDARKVAEIMGDDSTPNGRCPSQLLFIPKVQPTLPQGSRCVVAAVVEGIGQSHVDVFVEVDSNP
jgi:hypothetical protein